MSTSPLASALDEWERWAMTISRRTRDAFRRACAPSQSAADEICNAIDAASGADATQTAALASEALDNSAAVALTNADATITKAQGAWRRLPAATLTANRSVTLDPTGWAAGESIEITRLDLTAFTLAIINGGPGAGTLYTMPVSKLGYARLQFDGTNFALKSFGTQ